MVSTGIITDYAVFGAVAQMRYTEAVATLDADILVALPDNQNLDVLRPIYEFCAARGYKPEGEAIRIGNWPVQFIPAFSRLTEETIHNAESGDMEGIPLRVARPDYLAVIALSVGRSKDFARILALIDSGATDSESINKLCMAHDLSTQWEMFKRRFLNA